MALNGSGIRYTALVLGISPTTVIEELNKRIVILTMRTDRYSNNSSLRL
ncbi:MAG: hypothetical protein K6T90_00010 [Leptolyngbyaceae cyanobacterium HOT.MB2.61]|nr:hypothetical protein [Leptolyngbyaceae cyanobacterium HOT.MB2.61]